GKSSCKKRRKAKAVAWRRKRSEILRLRSTQFKKSTKSRDWKDAPVEILQAEKHSLQDDTTSQYFPSRNCESRWMRSVFGEDTDDTALDLDVAGRNHDGSHFGVGGLQADFAGAFAIEALEGSFISRDESDDDVAGVGDLGLLANDEVAIHDVILNHGIALDL